MSTLFYNKKFEAKEYTYLLQYKVVQLGKTWYKLFSPGAKRLGFDVIFEHFEQSTQEISQSPVNLFEIPHTPIYYNCPLANTFVDALTVDAFGSAKRAIETSLLVNGCDETTTPTNAFSCW